MSTSPANPNLPKLGGDTGQTPEERAAEARQLLEMIRPVYGTEAFENITTLWELNFIGSMLMLLDSRHFSCTGKQLFRLRDIKDKLVEKGLV